MHMFRPLTALRRAGVALALSAAALGNDITLTGPVVQLKSP
jgi:hypothetical protein